MKGQKVLLFAFLAILIFPALTFASYPIYHYPYVTPLERMIPNGEYIIYVEKEEKWQEVGSLSYDMYFREREISLDKYISTGNKIKVRIVQKGGGAAHIDSIFLGGKPPVEVEEVENGVKKLSKSDFDVIDAFEKRTDIIFEEGMKDRLLKLTARIESTQEFSSPIQFPLKNQCTKINKHSQFYAYTLDSSIGSIQIDGILSEVIDMSPFFQQYSKPSTGHPAGFTYGWVWNDDENLYIAIDFTGDNTMDGNKDYAKVYINTKQGLKEFKVSVPETKWGKPDFSYTKRVRYQHKVYEFKIPLSEIAQGHTTDAKNILLAFSAYGTFGVCCFPGGSCDDSISLNNCQFGNGTWITSASSCDPNPCAASIPTMTQWGMIIFVILAGLGAVLYMKRQTRKNN